MVVHSFDMELYRRREFGTRGPAGVVAAAAAAAAVDPGPWIDATLIDVSNYDMSTFDARCFYAKGVRRLVVGCQDEAIARRQIDAAASEGIETIALYGLPYFGGSYWHVFDDVEACLKVQSDYGIRPIMLDAEIDANTIWPDQPAPGSPSQRNHELLVCRRMVDGAGGRPIIYTNGSWWDPKHAGTTMFADCGLWYPHYGWGGTLRPAIRELPVPFGGWTTCVAHQAGSTFELCGRGRDINYLWEELDDVGITRAEYEDMVLANWAGSEERYTASEAAGLGDHALAGQTKPREERLAAALYRQAEAAAGRAQSLGQRAAQGGPGGPVVLPPGTSVKVAGSLVIQ